MSTTKVFVEVDENAPQYALNDVVEAKKLAKAFGVYPYNQPNYSMEME